MKRLFQLLNIESEISVEVSIAKYIVYFHLDEAKSDGSVGDVLDIDITALIGGKSDV